MLLLPGPADFPYTTLGRLDPSCQSESHDSRLTESLPACTIKPLQLIQNAAARLVFNEPKKSLVMPLFIRLHWLPVATRIKFKVLMLAYKTTSGAAPIYLNSLVQTYAPSRSMCSARERRLVVPSQRGTKSLFRSAESLAVFKKQIKTSFSPAPNLLILTLTYSIPLYSIPLYSIIYSILLYSTLFYSILLYSTLLYSIPLYYIIFYSIPLYSILFYSIPLCSILFHSILFYSSPLYSILLYSTLFHSILFHSILFNSILFHSFYSIPLYSIVFYSIHSIILYSTLFHSILFYSIPFYSIPLYSILFYSIPFYSILFHYSTNTILD